MSRLDYRNMSIVETNGRSTYSEKSPTTERACSVSDTHLTSAYCHFTARVARIFSCSKGEDCPWLEQIFSKHIHILWRDCYALVGHVVRWKPGALRLQPSLFAVLFPRSVVWSSPHALAGTHNYHFTAQQHQPHNRTTVAV